MYSNDNIGIALDNILVKIPDMTDMVQDILEKAKSHRNMEKRLLELVTETVEVAAGDKLRTIEYVQKNQSHQQLYVFVGTHWMPIPAQQFYDFCGDAVKKIGIPRINCFDYEFMCRVFEQVAFSLARFQKTVIPDGEVWINMQNGTLEIKSYPVFREHRAEDFFTYCLSYDYDTHAKCTLWRSFLNEVLPEQKAQQLLMEYVGYCFCEGLKLEKTAVFFGSGSNGKSVILDVLTKLFGHENVSYIGLSELTTDPEKRSLMENKLANISHESGKTLDTSVLKKIISGEPVDVRILYKGTHVMERYGKLFTSFNILPPSEHTYGYFRRWLLFPFNVTIPDDRQDVHLTEKLCNELPGIMNWVLVALQFLLVRKAFTQSPLCNEALNDYKRTSNSALLFLSDKCVQDSTGKMKLKDLYASYLTFCNEEGVRNRFGKGQFRKILDSWGASSYSYQGYIMYCVKMKSGE